LDAPLNKVISASQHAAIPSIEKQKALVEEQRRRFPDIENYPCTLSKKLERLRDDLTAEMLADNSGWQEILAMPEQVPDEVLQPK
jgi:hypothetical protein